VTDVQQVAQAYQTNTKMVMLETIANPVTQVADLKAIGTFCQQHGLIYLVDNTMTPAFMFDSHQVQASLLICSLTKYFAGHGQALGGTLIDTGHYDWQQYSNIASIYKTVDSSQWGLTQIRKRGLRDMGATLSGDAAHAIAVGMETMELRLARSCENALGLARFLSEHPLVEAVYYPGLVDHPQHQAASAYFSDYGGILSMDLASHIDPFAFLDQLQLVISATHLGDTRTLALPVAHTIFYENGAALRQQMGVGDGMIRISAGIESLEDLIADFTQAFNVFV
jgi:O-acetylhomoserine (thiol)-lyase